VLDLLDTRVIAREAEDRSPPPDIHPAIDQSGKQTTIGVAFNKFGLSDCAVRNPGHPAPFSSM
jgi:hypothetical protein